MAQRAVSRDHVLGLFAFNAFAAPLNKSHESASWLPKLFSLSPTMSDDLVDQWADRIEATGPEAVGRVLDRSAHIAPKGNGNYDHASALLHALLKALDQTRY